MLKRLLGKLLTSKIYASEGAKEGRRLEPPPQKKIDVERT